MTLVEELKRLGLACVSLRQKRFSQYPNKDELNGFLSDIEVLIDGLVVLLSKGAEVALSNALMGLIGTLSADIASIKFIGVKSKAESAGVPKEFFSQIAVMMGNAAIEGYKTTTKKYNSDNRPMQNEFRKTLGEVDNCIMLLDIANDASDDDDDDDIIRLESKIKMTEFTINMTAYADYSSPYRSFMLTDTAKNNRRENINRYKKKIQEIRDKAKVKAAEERKKAEKEKQARIAAYWEAHKDKKKKLDSEKEQLEYKKKDINAQIADINAKIAAATPTGALPSETEKDSIRDQISELNLRRSKLGVFAGKEKKQIGEQIYVLESRMESLNDKIEKERASRDAQAAEIKTPLIIKKCELDTELRTITKKISAIDAELKKDPGE